MKFNILIHFIYLHILIHSMGTFIRSCSLEAIVAICVGIHVYNYIYNFIYTYKIKDIEAFIWMCMGEVGRGNREGERRKEEVM